MTDEEKAKEYASEKCKECYMCDYADYDHPEINPYEVCPWYTKRKEGYLDGLKVGREESIEELKTQIKLYSEKVSYWEEQDRQAFFAVARFDELKKENADLKTVCDFNCPVHKLATHNACLTCSAVRNSPHHNLKNVSNEELQKIIKEAEAEMEM